MKTNDFGEYLAPDVKVIEIKIQKVLCQSVSDPFNGGGIDPGEEIWG